MTNFQKIFIPVRSREELLARLEEEQAIGWHGVSKPLTERQKLFVQLIEILEKLYEQDYISNNEISEDDDE